MYNKAEFKCKDIVFPLHHTKLSIHFIFFEKNIMPNNYYKMFVTLTHPQIMSKFINKHAHIPTINLTHANYTINTKKSSKTLKNS